MYQYFVPKHFKKQLKVYRKKFRSLGRDVLQTLEEFDPLRCAALGEGLFKMRLLASDLPKGKSKSFRLIILFLTPEQIVVPIVLYFKSEQAVLNKREIQYHVEMVRQEITTD